jgi:hypothetical protein
MSISTISLKNQKIYFICSGTSTNDIIKSINNQKNKEKKSFYDYFFSKKEENIPKISEDDYPLLDELGIKEIYMCMQNSDVKKIIDEFSIPPILPNKKILYTSLEYSSIESASIINNVTEIYPIPNISTNTNIKDKKMFDIFKKKIGIYKINNSSNNEETNIENYWNKKGKNIPDYFDIKTKKGVIKWDETKKKNMISLSRYNYNNFKKFLKEKCTDKYKNQSDIKTFPKIDFLLFISDSKLIIDNLKEIKDIKYKKDLDIIEHSSVWEIDITIDFEHNNIIPYKIINSKIKYNRFTKIYPTENNYKPLINNSFEYKYNNNTYKLFNSLNDIPINYIQNLFFYRYSKDKKSAIKKIFNKTTNKNKSKNKNNKNNKNNSGITFETLT